MAKLSEDKLKLARTLAQTFFTEDAAEQVFAAACCGRVVVCIEKPTHCKTCEKPIDVAELTPEDVPNF